MQDPSESARNPISVAVVTDKLGLGVLLYAYAMLLGATYLFGYWRAFGFDVFPYVSSIDYISAPLNRLLVLVSGPILFALVLFSQADRAASKFVVRLSLYLIFLYALSFAIDFYQAASRFVLSDFHYENEKSVLVISVILFAASCGFTYRLIRHESNVLTCATALILVQLGGSLSAGYSDGKAIFSGAANVFFLDNRDLCESGGVRDWVYLGRFSSKTFFMNTIDKRLCVTDTGSFNLKSRKFAEGL
ncbi:MAG: hypothetical protein ACPHN2_15240 [Sinimarinibacterium flocculans]|uniref:hypothetical protein n=1 Tax=Sinimarinibacterium flocculans TaxID=985250 RepID=UPI003C67C81D